MKPYRKPSQEKRPLSNHSQERKPSRRENRQEAILQAAAQLFANKGYGATSLHDIVHLSGGSLSTLYALFRNKAGLFHAIVTRRCEQITSILNHPNVYDRSVSEALTEHGIRFLLALTAEDTLATIRTIIAESAQFPELAQAFDNAGSTSGRQRVAAYLAEQMRRGLLRDDDPVRAAIDFCSLVLRDTQTRAILRLPYPKTQEAIEQQVAYAVKQFLRLYQKESAQGHDPQPGSV